MPSSPGSADTPDRTSPPRGDGESTATPVARAHAGDHALVYDLLLAVYQNPTLAEFQSSLEDPYYEPADRLLIRRAGRVVSHVHLTKRQMHYGEVQLPIGEVQWLATLPEFRSAGYARRLLEEADQQMRDDGAVLATLQTKSPELFEGLGWIACGRPSYLRVRARQMLAHFSDQNAAAQPTYKIRMWRQVELRALVEIYEQQVAGSYGPLQRDEAYWRWLITRQGYEQLLVAIEGDDTLDFGALAPMIVGYAFTRGAQIVEVATREEYAGAAGQLLARACGEAIERDHHSLSVHARPGTPLHQLVQAAGGEPCVGPGRASEMAMLKVLDFDELLRRLYPELHRRARDANLQRPFEIRLKLSGRGHRFQLTRRSAKLEEAPCDAYDVECSRRRFTQLLVGQLDLAAAVAARELKTRNKTLLRQLEQLFPPRPFWRPPLDSLPA